MTRILFFLFALAGTSLISTQSSSAQVVVYKIDFEQEGQSINYSFYEEGWVVADATGGPARARSRPWFRRKTFGLK